MGTMKAIVKKTPEKGFVLDEVPIPEINEPNEVKVKVLNASICGTDLHIWRWDEWSQERIKTPQIDGHEFVGEVVEVGPMVKGLKPGDIVASETHIPCGVCKQCKTGKMHICKNMKILGVDRDGVFAEYVVVPEIVLWKIDPSIPKEYASVMEPLGNAIHTTTAVDLRGKTVLITGAGPIGAMAVQVAKISGAATVIVSEISEYRMNMAKEMGADYIINPAESNLVEEVMKLTNGDGADVLLEMSGNPNALNDGIESLTNGGEAAILGVFPTNPVPFAMNTAVFKNISIHCITGRKMFETWQIASEWLRTKRIDLSKIITHVLPMEDFEKGFELMNAKKSGKIILKISE